MRAAMSSLWCVMTRVAAWLSRRRFGALPKIVVRRSQRAVSIVRGNKKAPRTVQSGERGAVVCGLKLIYWETRSKAETGLNCDSACAPSAGWTCSTCWAAAGACSDAWALVVNEAMAAS